jgi:hypothetical protein
VYKTLLIKVKTKEAKTDEKRMQINAFANPKMIAPFTSLLTSHHFWQEERRIETQ